MQSGSLVLLNSDFNFLVHFQFPVLLNLEGDGVSSVGIDYSASWEISVSEISSSANII